MEYAIAVMLTLIVCLLVSYAAANAFYSIACMKGHEERKYFWWTFLAFPIGALMVIALPDRSKAFPKPQVSQLVAPEQPYISQLVTSEQPYKRGNLVRSTHQWRCDNCGKMTDTNPCAYCGK